MRYPNLRYGNPNEFAYSVQGVPVKDVARRLRRSERSVKNWLNGWRYVPHDRLRRISK
ncbi:helix-turn-helix domain-containing protein [Herbaspirillum sp. 3R11]|uniref:helix-turn-helix domain-containing protein n=1 Tax=unclassified Herbaspirillum TaxID=2624150 RepID=UPI0032AF7771